MDNLGWNNPNEAIFNSGRDSYIDIDTIDKMVEIWQHEEATSSIMSSHQLCSLPPAIGTVNNFSYSDNDGISVLLPMSCSGNLSSSGESEAASQGSSQADSSRKRKSGFQIFFNSSAERKRPYTAVSTNGYEADAEATARVKEMMYRAAAMRPVSLEEPGSAAPGERPRRKNVRISSDPQTVAARHRRERISERLRTLQRLVPGGSKMDTASMLDEAANYLKFLKSQVTAFESLGTATAHDHHHHHPHLDFTFA